MAEARDRLARDRTDGDRAAADPLPGGLLAGGLPHLLDERANPDFRSVFGLLARNSIGLDSAVSRIRLSGLDLTPGELRGLDRIRLLLAEVNALTLAREAEAVLVDPRKSRNLRNVVSLMETGRIEIRSAPLAGWKPDFSVFHRRGDPWTLIVGLHWFARPFPHRGPALASLHGPAAAGLASKRFEELWRGGHDISPAILGLLREAKRRTGRGAWTGPPTHAGTPTPAGAPWRHPEPAEVTTTPAVGEAGGK